MTKNDKICVIIGKCFGRYKLTLEECAMLHDMKIFELVTKHGLNENQSREVLLGCQQNHQRHINAMDVLQEDKPENIHSPIKRYRRT